MRRKYLLFLSVFIVFLTVSCGEKDLPVDLEPPPTPVLTAESQWAVANSTYVRIMAEPDAKSDVDGILRMGDIVEVISKVGEKDGRTYWLGVVNPGDRNVGWVPDARLDVYDSPDRARTASEVFKE